MSKTLHKVEEKLEQGVHRTQESIVRKTGDPDEAEVLRTKHLIQEKGHAAAHRIEEGINKAVDILTGHPDETIGQKIDRALGNTTHP